MNQKISPSPHTTSKRMALYARVSTLEQTRGQYPSCESQIEELVAYCQSKGWTVQETIKDEGVSAGSLKRKGLTHLRWLVQSGQIDGVLCTWYDRLVRTREFYILDKEFTTNKVEFLTLHDPTDRNTASGRFLETMLVAAKTYEREQTGEKVRTKMRMRAEKGMWNGGLVPFGFARDQITQVLIPDEDRKDLVRQLFQVYVDTQSDFAVRNWLKAHNIPAPGGKEEWAPGSIRDLLMNRRYIAEIEVNRGNKGIEGLQEFDAYRIMPAPHEPLVPRELFELAESIRSTRAIENPNRGGKGKGQSYSRNQCGRVYLLQSNMACGICGAAMSPHYVYHKPNEKEKRRTASYVYHYTCAQKMKYRQAVKHSNRVLARVAEGWILDAVEDLVTDETILQRAFDVSISKIVEHLEPIKLSLAECNRALDVNQEEIDKLISAATAAPGALYELLAEKAQQLKREREQLKAEQRRLNEHFSPLNIPFKPQDLTSALHDFPQMRTEGEPEELRRLLRLAVRRLDWMPDGKHRVQYYLPTHNKRGKSDLNPPGNSTGHWFETPKGRAVSPSSSFAPEIRPPERRF